MFIISNGEIGPAAGALGAAKGLPGLYTGGWMAKDYLTEYGPMPQFKAAFGVVEHPSSKWAEVMEQNIIDSDGTVRICVDFLEQKQVALLCEKHNKPYFDVKFDYVSGAWSYQTPTLQVAKWIIKSNIQVLNVTGNSNKSVPVLPDTKTIGEMAEWYLKNVFTRYLELKGIKNI